MATQSSAEFKVFPYMAAQRPQTDLTGLFDEMQALMTLMPGTVMDQNRAVPTEEEVEAMFDNMPV